MRLIAPSSAAIALFAALAVLTSARAYSEETGGSTPAPSNSTELPGTFLARYQELVAKIGDLEESRKRLEEEARQLRATIDAWNTPPAGHVASLKPMLVPTPPPIVPAKQEELAPLFVRIGAAQFTPGGYLDFINVYRSTNVGSGIGTSFGSLPFSNAAAGQMGESRFGAQSSRMNVKVNSRVGSADLTGFAEVDFLGSQPTNAYVTSNSNTLRLRLYWADIRRGKWELLGGQAWSLVTPNRSGISPASAEVFLSQNVDTNYQIGFPWSRDPQLRIVHHTTDHVTLAASFENPQQYVGAGVTLPVAIPPSELDNGSNLATPSLHPDILGKAAYDTKVGGRALHLETTGVFRQFRVLRPSDGQRFTESGRAGSANMNIEVAKNLRTIVNTFYGSGGGRYIFGLGPDLIIRSNGSISPVRSGSGMAGLEYQVTPGWLLSGYYGLVYFQKNVAVDGSNLIGFGAPGAVWSNANRLLREPTIGVTRIFWKDPAHGALQVGVQYSLVERYPWAVPVGSPAGAESHVVFTNLRYVLP